MNGVANSCQQPNLLLEETKTANSSTSQELKRYGGRNKGMRTILCRNDDMNDAIGKATTRVIGCVWEDCMAANTKP